MRLIRGWWRFMRGWGEGGDCYLPRQMKKVTDTPESDRHLGEEGERWQFWRITGAI